MDMNPPRKLSPTESPLLFELDDEPLQETLTAWGGVPLVVQAFRSLGVPARVRQHEQIKQRERGYVEATMVESFVVLNAVGGECLGGVNRELVRELGRRCPEQRTTTVDQDATISESHKQQVLRTYEGERGYQPMLAVWAEMDAVLADEFRDGNVPAPCRPIRPVSMRLPAQSMP